MANSPRALGALSLDRRTPYVKPKIKNDHAAYGVINDGFFVHKDKFHFNGSMLYFDGEPNFNLYPLNKMANDQMNLFLDKLNGLGHEAAKRNKKTFTPYVLKEWTEEEEAEVPQVENVMGMPKFDDGKDNIR